MSYIIKFIKENIILIFITILLIIFQNIGTLFIPFLVADIIDVGIKSANSNLVIQIAIKMIFISFITGIVAVISSFLSANISSKFGYKIRQDLFEKVQELSVSDVAKFKSSSLLTRITNDVGHIQQMAMMFLQLILPGPIICAVSIVLTSRISPILALIPAVSIVLFLFVTFFIVRQARSTSREVQIKMDKMMLVVSEIFTGIRVIRAFDNSKLERKRTDKTFEEYTSSMIKLNILFAILTPVIALIIGISMAFILGLGSIEIMNKTMDIGSIGALTEFSIISLSYLTLAAIITVMLPRAVECFKRVEEVLNTDIEVKDYLHDKKLISNRSCLIEEDLDEVLEFKNVSFSYEGAESPVLEDISFTLNKGETTAIVGGTGSGKSSIAKAMLRFKDVSCGEIIFNSKNIKNLTQHLIRENISYVPQRAFLFGGTIKDNLRFGDIGASQEKLNKALDIACMKDYVNSLSEGFDSFVSQKGSNFSGGQKQRLSIARALVKKASIYFFDDSFSALDYKTDSFIRKRIKSELKDSSVVIVAQRVSTIKDADQIIVLDEGKMVGIGTHNELIESCNTYLELAKSQGVINEEVTCNE